MKKTFLIFLFIIFSSINIINAKEFYNIGVYAKNKNAKFYKSISFLPDYLSKKLKLKFKINPYIHKNLINALNNNKIDFLLLNCLEYSKLKINYNITPIATECILKNNKSFPKTSIIIITKNPNINDISDIKGAKLYTNKYSFIQTYPLFKLLKEKGINYKKDLSIFYNKKLSTQRNKGEILKKLKIKDFSVGIIKSESFPFFKNSDFKKAFKKFKKNHPKFKHIKIINRIKDDFPMIHSIKAYAYHPFCKTDNVSEKIANEVSMALLDLTYDNPICIKHNFGGFSKMEDYSSIIECYNEFKDDIIE